MELLFVPLLIGAAWFVGWRLSQPSPTSREMRLRFTRPVPRETTQGALGIAYQTATIESATRGFWGLLPSELVGRNVSDIDSADMKGFLAGSFPPELAYQPVRLGIDSLTVDFDFKYRVEPRFRFRGDMCIGVLVRITPIGTPAHQTLH